MSGYPSFYLGEDCSVNKVSASAIKHSGITYPVSAIAGLEASSVSFALQEYLCISSDWSIPDHGLTRSYLQ